MATRGHRIRGKTLAARQSFHRDPDVDLTQRTHWIFDMDGTLTVAVHDFDAIRKALHLPVGQPILEALATLPQDEAAERYELLDAIELELAAHARAQAGARELLTALRGRGARLGILTRNSARVALATLHRAGLADFFDPQSILGREAAHPKPDPAGVLQLLARWQTVPAHAVMVGDFQFDLLAGRRAGVATVYVDVGRTGVWSKLADHTVHDLGTLRDLAAGNTVG